MKGYRRGRDRGDGMKGLGCHILVLRGRCESMHQEAAAAAAARGHPFIPLVPTHKNGPGEICIMERGKGVSPA